MLSIKGIFFYLFVLRKTIFTYQCFLVILVLITTYSVRTAILPDAHDDSVSISA